MPETKQPAPSRPIPPRGDVDDLIFRSEPAWPVSYTHLNLWSKETPKKTVFFVTHDVDEAILLANHIIVFGQSPSQIIYECKIPEEKRATRETQFENPEILQLRNTLIRHINQDVAARMV